MCEARAVWMLRDCSCCDVAYLTSSCHAQSFNKITSLDGAVFPAGLKKLDLVGFHDGRLCFWCVYAMCEARAVWMLRDRSCCDVAYLTSACREQRDNKITSLDGVVFPAGLTTLRLVRFHDGRLCFVVCVCDVRGACGVDVARLLLLRRRI